jgi:formylglycine-generating enzyme required for sulfatase activity/predicted Ser/Thr protein kinase
MIGEKLGDYKIVASLGKGGFGSVWKGIDSNDTPVAIKVLNPQVLDNQKVVKKFFHEAMILAKLDHPGITRLLEFFPDGNNYAIVMEYVEGVELKKVLQQQQGLLPFDIAMKIAKQVLDAFQYALKNGILHRDIKPGNIMIDKHGNAKIMDFGIAKMSSTASHDTAASMLSVHYTAPERFDQSREVDARSDIYSLGLVFYEMFAGRRPFSATETSQIMFSHLNEIPDSPSKFVQALPPTVCGAILKALEKDPEDRFQDFAQFSRALDPEGEADDDATALTDDDMTVIMDAASEKAGAGAGRKKPVGLIAAVALILVIFAAAGYFYLQPPAEVSGPSGNQAVSAVSEPGVSGPKNSKGFVEIEHPADGMPAVRIPAGEFTMGSDKYSAERPVQQIFLDGYYIDKYPVTNDRFSKFVEATGYVTDAEKEGAGMVRIGRRWKKVDGANWRTPDGLTGIEGREDHPVSQVSYNDASQYCRWAGRELPTEAQWEKAARGPNSNEYPWGDQEPNDTMSNFDNLVGTTTPVDRYEKGQSFYGVFDMAGNVYQLTADWYATGERAPKNPAGPENGEERVIKGGSLIEGIESLRSANRDRYPPDYSSFLFGFRCATEEIKTP